MKQRPITQKSINNTPISIKNNLFYWQNLSDGNTIYSVSVPSGNYIWLSLTSTSGVPQELGATLIY